MVQNSSMPDINKVYFMGVGGIAMGNLAGLFKDLGYEVEGSDNGAIYSPMGDLIDSLKIKVYSPYSAENIQNSQPDLVVIGNVIRADNPEARFVLENSIPYVSLPGAVEKVFLCRHRSLVVAGTHGKSTTTSLLAWLLEQLQEDPSALVGAFVKSWERGYRLGQGDFAVIEGDEYDTAFFDKTPKFLHYKPYGAIITGIEFDHGDIYKNLDEIRRAFENFARLVEGFLVINGEDPYARELIKCCHGKVITYGRGEEADWRILSFKSDETGSLVSFRSRDGKEVTFSVPLLGFHNSMNVLATVATLNEIGIEPERISDIVKLFPGVRRRQDVIWDGPTSLTGNNITLIDDFAHHPTAVKETIRAVRSHYKGRRLITVFEPRTNTSKRKFFQKIYPQSFEGADLVLLKAPSDYNKIPQDERMDLEILAEDIRTANPSSQKPKTFYNPLEVVKYIEKTVSSGDVILFMSNGSMDNVPKMVREKLHE